jgi:translation initiation factor 1
MARPTKYSSLSDLKVLLPQSTQDGAVSPKHQITKEPWHDGKGKAVRLRLDTKGRKGKVVTLILDLHHNPDTLDVLAGALKRHCGAGGTVREGTIEIQGDQRDKASELLRALNYRVKTSS